VETESVQHGLFTWSLLNSFYSGEDDLISVHELAENIKTETEKICEKYMITTNYPKILTTGYDFVIAGE
jgi:hypothetical protein